MTKTIEDLSLSDRLQPRVEVEEWMARTGRRRRKKNIIFRHERHTLRPMLRLFLQATGLYEGGLKNALSPVIKKVTFRFPNLPQAFDGFEILHLSDLHIDGVDGLAEHLSGILSDLTPDVCLMTGDYRFEDDGPCDAVYPRMRQIVESISAKHGIFGILGNHDVSDIAHRLARMGVRMLVNEAVQITRGRDSVWLTGLDDDFSYMTDDLTNALSPVPSDAFKILLAHSPELFGEAAAAGIDVYLCGHTHAGQIRLPKLGSLRNNANCPKEYTYGPWTHGKMQAYTSPGVGCSSLPVRFNCPPEIILIELRCA